MTWAQAISCLYLAGIATAGHALFHVRSIPGTVAWIGFLITLPLFALPMYWVFGGNRFNGYREREFAYHSKAAADQPFQRVLEKLSGYPIRRGYNTILYTNGAKAFAAMLRDMESAQHNIIVQSFIVEEGAVSQAFTEVLSRKAQQGLAVFLLYDEIGSSKLSRSFRAKLCSAGVRVSSFNAGLSFRHRLKLNYRNHRKLVLVDSKIGYTGSLNLGDVYCDHPENHWRDTHLRIEGSVVSDLEDVFSLDWCWATGSPASWPHPLPAPTPENEKGLPALCMATSPADSQPTGLLYPLSILSDAKERIWIATPYFVPDPAIISTLRLAVVRGVEVRILLPEKTNWKVLTLAAESYLLELLKAGVRIDFYNDGFMHQKVVLIDDRFACIGSHNLDNRSLFLNFECSLILWGKSISQQVHDMLDSDASSGIPVRPEHLSQRSFLRKFLRRICRLFAPLL